MRLAVLAARAALGTALAAALAQPAAAAKLFPPWSDGRNDPATYKGLEFTVDQVDDMADFHGNLDDPKLVLFVGGNYFFAMAPLAARFEALHPEYKGRLFYITIPPGLLVDAMHLHDTFTSGNLTFTIHPDLYAAGYVKVKDQIDSGLLVAPDVPYATNDLAIMIPKGNPGHIASLRDLGKSGVRLVMPNPKFEGVVKQIKAALEKAGGDALVTAVYDTKVKSGETILTHIHHRETPLFLMQGKGVAGVTWRSEAMFQEQIGNPLADVKISDAENSTAVYGAAAVKNAPHPQAAKLWLDFLASHDALAIFETYGFTPPPPANALPGAAAPASPASVSPAP